MVNNSREAPLDQQPVPVAVCRNRERQTAGRRQWRVSPLLRWLIGTLTLLGAVWLLGGPFLPHLAQATPRDPVAGAWEAARRVGSYEFSSDIRQVTIPTTRITNVGRS